jgi:hypothetical protein
MLMSIPLIILGILLYIPFYVCILLFLCTISIFIRGNDYVVFCNIFFQVVKLFIPVSIAVTAFGYFKNILIYFPSIAILEGLRIILFLNNINYGLFLCLIGFLESLVLVLLLYEIFKVCFDYGRKTGKILLE